MYRLFFVALFGLGCATSQTAAGSVGTSTAAANGTVAAADQEKLVCRWEQEIGSNVRKKVCVPASEVDDADSETSEDLRLMQNRTTRIQMPPPTPGPR